MRPLCVVSAFLALCLLLTLLPHRAAAQQGSVPITFTEHTRQYETELSIVCAWELVGSHADPVGNGSFEDYEYAEGVWSGRYDPHEWTGLHDDIPGERLTFWVHDTVDGEWIEDFEACDYSDERAWMDGFLATFDANAYYAPPPNEPPTACFKYEEADELLTINFDASCSEDEDGEVVSYDWDFGGPGTSGGEGAQTSFTYDDGGTYEVTLTVTDDEGDDDSDSQEVSVEVPPLVVNSTGDDPLDGSLDPAEGGCSTGEDIMREGESEDECTLRAAMQIAAARTASSKILFDIPESNAVHRIAPEGESFPAVPRAITLQGPSEDGTPVEIDGGGLGGGIGFELGSETGAATIEGLAFYGFPSTVLAVRGRGSVVTSSRFGSDWAGSYTSTDPAATDPLRNGGPALLVMGDETRIGGPDGEGNLIIGSTVGVFVDGARDVEILGNDIGVLESPHERHGIELHRADGVIVGSFLAGNSINYNLEYGILIDEATRGARIQNNEIIRSRMDGILVRQAAAGGDPVLIGGAEEGDGNTIERSIGAGIRVTGSGDSAGGEAALLIQGNRLRANEAIGIRLEGGSAVQIGGATGTPGTGAGNDIEDGIELDPGRSSWVQGNRIARLHPETGYSTAGAATHVGGTGNVIGGETPAEGNVIYGVVEPVSEGEEEDPSGFGIWDAGTTTTIQFNMVGTEGALHTGVVLSGTNSEVIENTISGNSHVGLSVRAAATIEGNYIGVTPTGNGALPNGGPGIEVFTQATIGGYKEGEACERPCNVISGNTGPGILIRREAAGTMIQGNMIGVGVDGLTHVGNGESGIVALADNVRIGGQNDVELLECKGPCNIIAANGGDGIRNFEQEEYANLGSSGGAVTYGAGNQGASGFVIEGNFIGTGLPIPGSGNAGHGIALGALGSNHRVGATGTGAGNLITGNAGAGVIVLASTEDQYINVRQWVGGQGNQIRGNRIHGNGSVAIDLYPNYLVPGGDGWNALGTEDLSYGPNKMLNWPYLVESGEGGTQGADLLVLWTGPPDAASSPYSLDVYTNASCRGAMGEAGNYLVSRDVTFPVGGGTNVNAVRVDVPFVESMPYYSATLTDSEGNTSEVSNCRRAGDRPAQALQNVSPGIRTLINRLLLTLQEGEAGKTRADVEVMVLRLEEASGGDLFEEAAALTPGGAPVVPQSTQGGYWEVVAPDAPASLYYDVCLDVSAISDAADALVLGRGTTTNGVWRPYDTYLETVDGVNYACADGLTAQQLTLGAGTEAVLAAPMLLTPAPNATDVAMSTTFTWQPLSEATSYDFQVALDVNFTMRLHDETSISGTEATPSDLADGQQHVWRVRGITASGEAGPWSVPFRFTSVATRVDAEDVADMPADFTLEANYPNPFNPQTTIGYSLPQASEVRLVVYDILGRAVATLAEGMQPAGRHEVVFEAGDLPSGMYLYRLDVAGRVLTGRMVLLK